jgi:ribosomal protein RSM22 (predicted rRNA methylase)
MNKENFYYKNFTSLQKVSSKWPRLIIRDPKKSKKTFDSWTCNNDGKIDHMISSKLRNKY